MVCCIILLKYNTIDIDTNNKDFITTLKLKIYKCHFLEELIVKDSPQKGTHFILKCLKECDLCRFVFDDQTRYAYDQFRKEYSQNVLFSEKEYFHGNKKI